MTLEEKAEQFADNIGGLELTCSLLASKDKGQAYRLGRYEGYLAGAKENGVVWHDLRKDPNDLPKIKRNKSFTEVLVRVSHVYGVASFTEKTFFVLGEDITKDVIAWCEIPKFER